MEIVQMRTVRPPQSTSCRTLGRARGSRLVAQICLSIAAIAAIPAIAATAALAESEPPPVPVDAPVFLVGHPEIDGSTLAEHRASLAMGAAGKEAPLGLGQTIEARALQESTLKRLSENGREIVRRSTEVRRPGSNDVLARAMIEMDASTLLPLRSEVVRGGATTTVEYDWESFVVRQTPGASGAESDELHLDIEMFEVAAHDVWMAALPLEEGFVARIPTVFAATGVKYWAVPRVVGSERVDLGDGVARRAWVVELDWWGMGAANDAANHSLGGGKNGSGGPGGKYWVLDEAPAGVPRVVRVRTEVDPETDSVIQLQSQETSKIR